MLIKLVNNIYNTYLVSDNYKCLLLLLLLLLSIVKISQKHI